MPLLQEIELNGSYRATVVKFRSMLMNLSSNRLQLVRALTEYFFNILKHQKKIGEKRRWGHEANQGEGNMGPITLQSMAHTLATMTCRHVGSSYLSIKHKDLVEQVDPAIAFLLEHYGDVFTSDFGSSLVTDNTEATLREEYILTKNEQYVAPPRHIRKFAPQEREEEVPMTVAVAPPVEVSNPPAAPEQGYAVAEGAENGMMSPEIRRRRRPSRDETGRGDQAASHKDYDSRSSVLQNLGWEWGLLETLVLNRVKNFANGNFSLEAPCLLP